MTIGRALALAALSALAGCSAVAPYETAPPAPSPGAAVKGPRIAFCYDGFAGGRAAVGARATRACPARTSARYLGTDLRMNHCPLLSPARASFLCAPEK